MKIIIEMHELAFQMRRFVLLNDSSCQANCLLLIFQLHKSISMISNDR